MSYGTSPPPYQVPRFRILVRAQGESSYKVRFGFHLEIPVLSVIISDNVQSTCLVYSDLLYYIQSFISDRVRAKRCIEEF